ncbi:MAG: hypothetical protein AABY22_36040, partial [Nanoarchaeota archaeon]
CDSNAIPNKPINNIAYLGFGEIIEGGIVEVGDIIYLKNRPLGIILGFDETHFPNHYNIIIKSEKLITGLALEIKPKDIFSISFEKGKHGKILA